MKNDIHFCTELEWPDRAEALRVAIQENPGNVLQFSFDRNMQTALNSFDAPYVAVLFQKMWTPGKELNIFFLGTVDPAVRQKIIHYANQWLN